VLSVLGTQAIGCGFRRVHLAVRLDVSVNGQPCCLPLAQLRF
jgi:hypothetical protein